MEIYFFNFIPIFLIPFAFNSLQATLEEHPIQQKRIIKIGPRDIVVIIHPFVVCSWMPLSKID